jgi:hypothetical protein
MMTETLTIGWVGKGSHFPEYALSLFAPLRSRYSFKTRAPALAVRARAVVERRSGWFAHTGRHPPSRSFQAVDRKGPVTAGPKRTLNHVRERPLEFPEVVNSEEEKKSDHRQRD